MRASAVLVALSTALGLGGCQAPGEREEVAAAAVAERAAALATGAPLTPASADPPTTIAARFAATRFGGDLALARVSPVADGALVILDRRYHGLPVLGGRVAVRTDSAGRIRWSRGATLALARTATIPSLDASAAARRAGVSRPVTVELAIAAPPTGPARLVWRVVGPTDPVALVAPRVTVDATTGAIVTRENLIDQLGRARVFRDNPVVSPTPIEVTLPDLGPAPDHLLSADVRLANCPDDRTCRETSPRTFLHACHIEPLATADGSGDFVYPVAADTAPADEFAEVQAYYHASRALAVLRGLGFTDLAARPLLMISNYHVQDGASLHDCAGGTTYHGDRALAPFNNAFFTPIGEGLGVDFLAPALVFGQGTAVDFAYDGDAVIHELGHAVTFTLAPDLGHGAIDEDGLDLSTAALHEGLSDLLVLMVTGEPTIGEYVGSGFGTGEPTRTLANQARCPDDLVGEVHHDSLPLTGALYQARSSLAEADRRAFDRALLVAWAALDVDTDFDGFARAVVAELAVELGADTAAQVGEVLAARGVLGSCGHRVRDAAKGIARAALPGGFDPETGPHLLPGPFQLGLELTQRTRAIELAFTFDTFAPEDNDLAIAWKAGGAPIAWQAGDEPTGDYDGEAAIAIDDQRHARVHLDGEFGPGLYHLQFLDRGADGTVYDLKVTPIAADPEAGCATGGPAGAFAAGIVLLALACARRVRVVTGVARAGRPRVGSRHAYPSPAPRRRRRARRVRLRHGPR